MEEKRYEVIREANTICETSYGVFKSYHAAKIAATKNMYYNYESHRWVRPCIYLAGERDITGAHIRYAYYSSEYEKWIDDYVY